jgi:uncharacterized protein (UPF0548 family)
VTATRSSCQEGETPTIPDMAIRLHRATAADLASLLERSRNDTVTYAPTGCSLREETPADLKRRHWTNPLHGHDAFERAVEAIRSWAVHRGAGLAIAADGPIAVGTNVVFSAPLPIGFVDGTCRIVAVVDETDRSGFAYGTLSVHPEIGEEAFLVVRDETGGVRFDVEGVSRPAQPLARLLPPVADRLQDAAVRRYLAAMHRAVAN